MEDPFPWIIFILLIIVVRALFSLMETAFISSRKTWLRAKAEGGDKKYRKVLEAVEDPTLFLSALRIGIIFLGILAGVAGGLGIAQSLGSWFAAGNMIPPWDSYLAGGLVTLAITLVGVLLGDLLPKQIALVAPERIAAAALPFIKVLGFFCKPLIALSALIFKICRIERIPSVGMTEDELHIALLEGEKSGIVESKERTMVEGVFYLGDRPVSTFMTHRSEIVWLDLKADPEVIRTTAFEHRDQHYFPVAEDNLDNIAGVVSVQDILLALLEGKELKSILKAPAIVPETMSALKAFEAFKKGEVDFLLVMDEYSGFAGVLSLRDLVEAIVGQLSTPAQDEDTLIKQDDGTYLADGSLNIDQAVEALSLGSILGEHQEYHTLAGFILSLAGEIPRTGADFAYRDYRFKILNMDGNRIDKVLIYPPGHS